MTRGRTGSLRLACAGVLAALLGLGAGVARAADASAVRIAVAPFEAVAPPGTEVPDLAALLADRIGTRGVDRVVGPAAFENEPSAEPDDDTVKAWAAENQVAAVAVGRATRLGSQISVTVRLRSGESGAVVATYVNEILRQDQLGEVVDRLTTQLVDGAAALMGPGLSPVSSRGAADGPKAAPADPKASGSVAKPFGIATSFDSSHPLSINSDQLEAFQNEGRRRLVFTKNVVVVQGDLTIKADRLEAHYPENASQPSKLIADGRVRLVQGKQQARCDRAVYERAKDTLLCRGNAELRDGADQVRGREIVFDLARETVVVKGGASVVIAPKQDAKTQASEVREAPGAEGSDG